METSIKAEVDARQIWRSADTKGRRALLAVKPGKLEVSVKRRLPNAPREHVKAVAEVLEEIINDAVAP